MFDLVPFAGAGGQVANRDLKTGFIGQLLQLGFPQPGPVTVAASTHGRDQQTTGSGVGLLAHHNPPAPDAFYGKSGGVMIRSHVYPTGVLPRIIHPIGSYLTKRGDLKMEALPVFSRIEALITREDFIKGVIVESTAQPEHFVAVDDIPPCARAFHPHMADEFVG
jgi:hypothetical protein